MGFKIKFDTNKIMREVHKNIKKEYLFDVKCPKCNEIAGKYSYNYINDKRELFCEICKENFLVNINYNIK